MYHGAGDHGQQKPGHLPPSVSGPQPCTPPARAPGPRCDKVAVLHAAEAPPQLHL